MERYVIIVCLASLIGGVFVCILNKKNDLNAKICHKAAKMLWGGFPQLLYQLC